jgi:hypothetical protein
LAHSKSPPLERPTDTARSSRDVLKSTKSIDKSLAKPKDGDHAPAAAQLLTNTVFRPITSGPKTTKAGDLQPKPLVNTGGEEQDYDIIHDDDFPVPRSLAHARELLQQTKDHYKTLQKKKDLTRADREFILIYEMEFGSEKPRPKPSQTAAPAAPRSREELIQDFVETHETVVRMEREIDEEYEKIKPFLTPADMDDSWLERIPPGIFSRPKPN